MKYFLFLFVVLVSGCGDKYPAGDKLKADEHGIIHHPTYGDYPAEVKFKEGMTLMPGQSATVGIVIEATK